MELNDAMVNSALAGPSALGPWFIQGPLRCAAVSLTPWHTCPSGSLDCGAQSIFVTFFQDRCATISLSPQSPWLTYPTRPPMPRLSREATLQSHPSRALTHGSRLPSCLMTTSGPRGAPVSLTASSSPTTESPQSRQSAPSVVGLMRPSAMTSSSSSSSWQHLRTWRRTPRTSS
jgi:hypothetical protein